MIQDKIQDAIQYIKTKAKDIANYNYADQIMYRGNDGVTYTTYGLIALTTAILVYVTIADKGGDDVEKHEGDLEEEPIGSKTPEELFPVAEKQGGKRSGKRRRTRRRV